MEPSVRQVVERVQAVRPVRAQVPPAAGSRRRAATSRDAGRGTLMPWDSELDAIVPMLCVTLAALVSRWAPRRSAKGRAAADRRSGA